MKKIRLLMLVLVFTILAVGCSSEGEEVNNTETEESNVVENNEVEEESSDETEDDGPKVVVDLLGREVEIPENPERFVNVGVGSLRLYTYVADAENIVGVEQMEIDGQRGAPYSMVNTEYYETLPVIGLGGPRNSAEPEAILAAEPDVIFDMYSQDAASADELQEKTGTPVVVLSYGEVQVFDDDIYESISLIGEVTGNEDRAEEVINLMKDYKKDLEDRVADVDEEEKPDVYVGALGSRGAQGIESTRANYTLTNVLNVNNVADQTGETGSFFIDKEQLLEWDPEYIFIDSDGIHIVREDYKENPEFYNSLTAFKEENVYTQLPFIMRHTNMETAIADMYHMGKIFYPERFEDIDPVEKADEIYINFLGEPFYEKMAEDYEPFGKVDLEK